MCIAHPFKIITLNSRRNSFIAIMILIIFSSLLTLPRLLEIQIRERPPVEIYASSSEEKSFVDQCNYYNQTNMKLPSFIRPSGTSCNVVCGCYPKWVKRPTNRFWYHIVVETTIKFTLPFLLLLGFNAGIIINLAKTYKFRSKIAKSKLQVKSFRRSLSIKSTSSDKSEANGVS